MTWSAQQEEALVAVRKWFIDPASPQIFRLFGFAGTGKTTLSQEIANLIEDDGDGKVLYAAFTGKAALVMRQKGCHKASTIHSLIYTLDDDGTFIPKFILNEDSDVKDAKLVIIDECFVSGTLVDTPFGPQRIETLAPGGLIVNAAGVDRIVATARKEAIHLVRLKFGDATLTCSGNHPFFTQRGLISASELRPGDKLVETSSAMRLLRQAVHAEANAAEPVLRQSLLDALAQKPSRLQAARLHPAACAEVGRREEALAYVGTPRCHQRNRTNSQLEPKFASRGPEQDQRRASRDESSAAAPRGQWARSNEAATPSSSCARTRMDHGADRLNQNTTAEVAGGIQDRRWASRPQDRDRSGWSIAFCEADAGERQAQGGVSAFRRVDSVEVLEQSDPRLDQHRHADGKLYLFMGDQGRRGWMQNLPHGPFTTAPFQDDTFGGPEPDNAHLSGVILRLNDDGTAPTDNPFFAAGAAIGGELGANIQKIYSYGHRNGFGMAFDPYSGFLWDTENADDAYSELNRVIPGMNGGWVQLAGPLSRISDWKFIETTQFGSNLQQVRYPPTRAAYTAALALSRMFMLPGATYVDPDLSWRFEIGPAGTTFVKGTALGAEYDGTLWMGSARGNSQVGANGGSVYRFELTSNRLHVDVSADPRLADRVADNLSRAQKFDGTESETLQIGTGFGTTPSIEQGPEGNLYVVSLTDNAIYKISHRP